MNKGVLVIGGGIGKIRVRHHKSYFSETSATTNLGGTPYE